MKITELKQGCVVKRNGNIMVVRNINIDVVRCTSINDGSISYTWRIEPYSQKTTCWNCYQETDEGVEHDPACKLCKGIGEYTKRIHGLSSVKLVAKTLNRYRLNVVQEKIKKLQKEERKLKKLCVKL